MESSLYHKQEGSVDTETETHTHCCGCCTALVGNQQRRRTEREIGERRPGCHTHVAPGNSHQTSWVKRVWMSNYDVRLHASEFRMQQCG